MEEVWAMRYADKIERAPDLVNNELDTKMEAMKEANVQAQNQLSGTFAGTRPLDESNNGGVVPGMGEVEWKTRKRHHNICYLVENSSHKLYIGIDVCYRHSMDNCYIFCLLFRFLQQHYKNGQ